MTTPINIDESAMLNTGLKNSKYPPPINGIHSGHTKSKMGKYNMSITCP
jgi:hypothetical protein